MRYIPVSDIGNVINKSIMKMKQQHLLVTKCWNIFSFSFSFAVMPYTFIQYSYNAFLAIS